VKTKPMLQDRLNEALLRRLEELGLPPSVLEFGEFRQNFLEHRWVMFVRDGDSVANVHLVQPREQPSPVWMRTANGRTGACGPTAATM